MQKRFSLIIVLTLCSQFVHAQPLPVKWDVPLQYSPPTDNTGSPAVSPPPSNLPPEEEDLASAEERLNNEVRILWDEIERAEKQQKQTNDINILPIKPKPLDPEKVFSKTPIHPKTNRNKPIANKIKNEKERLDALLRAKDKTPTKTIVKDKTADKNNKTAPNKTQSATVALPPSITVQPKPVLTRKQVLEEEIAREKAALKSAKSQLLIAQKRGQMALIQKLRHMIRDRELNVQAISRELLR